MHEICIFPVEDLALCGLEFIVLISKFKKSITLYILFLLLSEHGVRKLAKIHTYKEFKLWIKTLCNIFCNKFHQAQSKNLQCAVLI